MTATIDAPEVAMDPRPVRVVTTRTARRLRIELRRSTMPFILPLIAALFWFDSYRPSESQPAIWVLRTFWNMGQGHTIIDFGPYVAGVAAWIAARDGRRATSDLVTAAADPRWTAQLTTWLATAIWSVGAYLVYVGVLFAVYAFQGVQGTPPWWWVGVGAAAVTAFCSGGFALGVYFPSRFTAPLAAFAGLFVLVLSSQTGFNRTSGWAWILPTNSNGNFQPASGVFYPYLPDLPIARIIFLLGIAAALIGVFGLSPGAGGPSLRRVAVGVTASGIAASVTAVALAATAHLGPHGVVIPALHDAANDHLISTQQVCADTDGVAVCLNPAYRTSLPYVIDALDPVLSEIKGLPGAPQRATQVGGVYSNSNGEAGEAMTLSGSPLTLAMPLDADGVLGAFGTSGSEFDQQVQLLAVHAFVGAGNGLGTDAQQAVQATLLNGAGVHFTDQPQVLSSLGLPGWAQATGSQGFNSNTRPAPATGPIYVAAQRLTALPAVQLHSWLAANVPALRSGQLTLAQLP